MMLCDSVRYAKTCLFMFGVTLAFRCIILIFHTSLSHPYMTSISLFHPDNAPASRDAKSCVSRSACHSFYCQTVARAFLSLLLVRRKILRLYFC